MTSCRHTLSAKVPKPAMTILVTVEPSGAVHADVIAYTIGEERLGSIGHSCTEVGPFDLLLDLPLWLEGKVARWLTEVYPRSL